MPSGEDGIRWTGVSLAEFVGKYMVRFYSRPVIELNYLNQWAYITLPYICHLYSLFYFYILNNHILM